MPASLGDPAADRRAAGERHHVHALVCDQLAAQRRTGTDHDLQDVPGQAGLGQELRQAQRRERCRRGRLEHHDVGAGQSRRHLVGDEVQRKVERRDRGDHAARLADRPAEPVLAALVGVHLDDLAGRALGLFTGPAKGRGSAPRFDPRVFERLATLEGDEASDLLGVVLEQVRGAFEDLGPLPGRRPAPFGQGLDRAVEDEVELLEARR